MGGLAELQRPAPRHMHTTMPRLPVGYRTVPYQRVPRVLHCTAPYRTCTAAVGEFKLLALRADQDGHLRQKLQHVLKLSKEKWEEARDHAMRAVVADGRMRAWYADRRTCEVGILFTARLGNGDLEKPVGEWVGGRVRACVRVCACV